MIEPRIGADGFFEIVGAICSSEKTSGEGGQCAAGVRPHELNARVLRGHALERCGRAAIVNHAEDGAACIGVPLNRAGAYVGKKIVAAGCIGGMRVENGSAAV